MDKTPRSLEELFTLNVPSREQKLPISWHNQNNVQVWLKRDDLIHPIISGNKWRKLSRTLRTISKSPPQTVISFGGGYSNHLHALAYCCHKLSISLIAIVRGDYSNHMTPMLKDIQRWGAKIKFVTKTTYQQRTQPSFINSLNAEHPDALVIPEGGSQREALQGVQDIVNELSQPFDCIIAPVASGGTLAGLSRACTECSVQNHAKILGVAVLKGENYLESLVEGLSPSARNWQIEHGFHFGGYAKSSAELDQFCAEFMQSQHIPIEPVYSGKMLFALKHMIENNEFPHGSNVLALHTGGLQGARSA